MRILIIGQLPKEAGGNYTTGAAKVVFELSKQHADGVELFTYATNAPAKSVIQFCNYPNQYIGYIKSVYPIIRGIFLHPAQTFHEWHHYRRVDHENPLRYAFYKANICRAIELVQPDLIHVHSIGNVSATRFAIGDKQIPLLLTCHGIFYRGDTEDVVGRDRYLGNLPLCDFFTGLTEESRHELTDILGISADRYAIIPNGVDSSKFYFSSEWRNRIRQEMKVKEDTMVFITVASLQERKGQLAFIEVLEQLGINFQYWLVGTGPDKEKIERYVTDHHLQGRVKLLGYHDSDDLYRYYSAADIYAHPSWKEGQALSEIEAHAVGLRTIANSAIAGTLVGNVKDSQQYCIINFSKLRMDIIKDWLSLKVEPRESREDYDWRYILGRYVEVYKTITREG